MLGFFITGHFSNFWFLIALGKFVYTTNEVLKLEDCLQVILDMEGAKTFNKAAVMGEFTSDQHGCRNNVETSTVQVAKVNTDQIEDKAASDQLGYREVVEAMICSQSVVQDNLLECMGVKASNISKSLVQDSSHCDLLEL